MRRREFIGFVVGGAAAIWPFAVYAQQQPVAVIGFLSSQSPDGYADRLAAFRQGLKESGYAEGRNLTIEYRWANNEPERLPALAADLVSHHVALIVATGGVQPALAAKAASATTPIVFSNGTDPVKSDLVASLGRPGGNTTGILVNAGRLMEAKRLQLLHEMTPASAKIGYLVNPNSPNAEQDTQELQTAASMLGLDLHVQKAGNDRELDAAFATLVQQRIGAVAAQGSPFLNNRMTRLATLAVRHAVPTIYSFREFPTAGGLMSYGSSLTAPYREAAIYAGRILSGEKAADLPVQQPTKFELVINLKTARVLGLTVPPNLLALADEVIE